MIDGWPFEDSPNVAVITLRQVLDGSSPILRATHDQHDGAWQFLGRDPPSEEDARIVALKRIVSLDPSVRSLHDLPEGWTAVRDGCGLPWRRLKS